MKWPYRELTLLEVLGDPMVQMLIAADHVDQRELKATLSRVASLVNQSSVSEAGLRAGCD